METFAKLFERFLVFVYHCFDRIVIQGYLPLLTPSRAHRPFLSRCTRPVPPITPQLLAKRTLEYRGWVEGYAPQSQNPHPAGRKGRNPKKIPSDLTSLPWSGGINRASTASSPAWKWAAPSLQRCPTTPTDDPDYRIIRRVPSRYLHYYFYIRDPVIGPLAMCVGTFPALPDGPTYLKGPQLHRD
ncbi:MAG: hypothetical protein WDO73_19065 [Ignavibacteriota bacterium]